jgi:hypothetical protein
MYNRPLPDLGTADDRTLSYIISYRILYRVTCIRLVCKTYP